MSSRSSAFTRSLIFFLTTLVGFTAMVAAANADREFSLRYSANEPGGLAMIANTNMTCSTANGATGASTCADARNAAVTSSVNSANDYRNNNAHTSAYIDVDSDSSTFNSSTANQSLPAGSTILYAALYWGGHYSGASSPADPNLRNQVKFKLPGASSYQTVTASTLDDGIGANAGRYQAFADVTNLVKTLPNAGNGTYTVANIQSAIGSDRYAGWSLVVAYKNPNESMKNMTIFDGLVSISGTITRDINISGFLTPPAGPVNAQVGFVTWEGDLGLNGDRAQFNGQYMSDAQHPSTNFFDSRISRNGTLFTDRNPAYPNSLGMDAAWTTPPPGSVANSATSAKITVNSTGDQYLPGVILFQTEIFSPKVDQTKTATDVNGGDLEQGDVITYKITGKNTGDDGTSNFVLRDPIPPNTTYVPGSMNIVKSGGAATGPRTDQAGDDTAEYDGANQRVIFRLGQGSNASVGGNIPPNGEYEVTFQVRVNGPDVNPVPNLTVIENEATATFNSQTGGVTLQSDADTDVTVKTPDLRILKTRTGADFVAGGTSEYTMHVDNHGSANTQGEVTVSDPLAAGLTATAVNAPGWTCNTLPADHLTCSRSDVLAPGDSYPDIVVTVSIGDDVENEVENLSTVSGGGDANLGDNTSSSTNPVSRVADLALTKTASKHNVHIGEQFSYALEVTNHGPSRATSVTITDEIPSGLSFVSADPGCTFEPVSGTVVCAIGTLANGASTTVNVTVKVDGDAGGEITNSASVTAQQTDPNPNNNTDTETVDASGADLEVTKTLESPAPPVKTGDTVTYKIVVKNNGPSDATGVVLYDALPAGLTNVTADDNSCTVAEPSITCALGDIDNGDSVTIEVTGKVKANQSSLVNTASATGNEDDPTPENNTSTVTTPVTPQVDLSITKTASVTQIVPGSQFTYTFTVKNNGPDDATGVNVADGLPAGVTFVSSDDCGAVLQTLACSVGNLASGDSVELTVLVSAANGISGNVVNTATVTGDQPDPTPGNNESTVTTPVKPHADLGVVKTKKSPATVKTGDTVTYELVVTNHGPSNATGVVVSDALPAGLTDVTADNGCNVVEPDITCNLGNLANGASVTITVTGKVKPNQSSLVNTANVTGNEDDPTPGNNTSTVTTPVTPQADLAIVKEADQTEVDAGGNLVYTFKVTNNGPDDVQAGNSITITDTLPAGVTYVDGAPGCNASGQVVTCSINYLLAGTTKQTGITVKVTDDAADPVVNTAHVTSDVPDPNPDNNESTVTTPVNKKADVQIVKTVDNPNPQAGDTITYTLTVKNNGPGVSHGVVATDELPTGVTFVSADAPCTEAGGQVTCAAGTLQPGEQVEYEIKVKIDPWAAPPIAGDHGIDVQKVETQVDLNPGETRTMTAQCPEGFFVSDGSVRIDHIDQGTGSWLAPQVLESRATDSRTWQGTVTNTASGRAQAKIFAVCIRETTSPDTNGHDLKVTGPVTVDVALEPGSNEAVLECPAGSVAIAPGFIADSPGHLVYSQPEGNGWKFIYDTDADVPGDQVQFSISCLDRELVNADNHSHDLALQRIWAEETIEPGQVHEVQLICPDGSKGIVGGWDMEDGLYSLGNDPRPVTRAFKVYNPTGQPLKVRYSLLCLGDRTSAGSGEIGPKDITNTADVTATTADPNLSNNHSSVTITADPVAGSGPGTGPVPDGDGKPPVNNPTDIDSIRPGVTAFRVGAHARFTAGTVRVSLKASGKAHGVIKLVTIKKIKLDGRTLRKGTVLAKGKYRFNQAGKKVVKMRVTRIGRKALKHKSLRKARLVIGGKSKIVRIRH